MGMNAGVGVSGVLAKGAVARNAAVETSTIAAANRR
jgi:hypothetical protein